MVGGGIIQDDRWWDDCTCPGSDRQRAEGRRRWKQDRPPTMAERERRQRAWDDELSQASAAVFLQAKGQSAGVIRQLLIDQLRSQGSEVPPDGVLDMKVKSIQHSIPPIPPPNAGLFASARALVFAYRQHRSVVAEMRSEMQSTRQETLEGPHGEPPYVSFFGADESLPMSQVTVDQRVLSQLARPDGTVYASLLPQASTEPHSVAVFIHEYLVGVLPPAGGALYRPAMTVAAGRREVLMVRGVIDSLPDGEKRLRIYAAGIQ